MMLKFLAKIVMSGLAVSLLLFWYADVTFMRALVIALIFSVAAWLIGDQLILRYTNNAIATVADGVMCAAYLWVVAALFNLTLNAGEIVIIAAVAGIAEWWFHRYMLKPERFMTV